jgi:hypothetical protein
MEKVAVTQKWIAKKVLSGAQKAPVGRLKALRDKARHASDLADVKETAGLPGAKVMAAKRLGHWDALSKIHGAKAEGLI